MRRPLALVLAAFAVASCAVGRGEARATGRPGDPYVQRALEEYDLFYGEKALSSLRAATRVDPGNPRGHAYVVLFGPRDDTERAEALASLRVLQAGHGLSAAELALVQAAYLLGTVGPHAAQQAIRADVAATLPELAFWKAELSFRSGDFTEAANGFQSILLLPDPPFQGRAYDHLAASLIFRQRTPEALEAARGYATAFPGEGDALGVLATALALAGRGEEAQQVAETALRLKEDEDTLAGLGKVQALAGDFAGARDSYLIAIVRAGDRRRVLRRAALGMLWLVDGDAARAREAVAPCLPGGTDATIPTRGACLFVAGLAEPSRIPQLVQDLEALAAAGTLQSPVYGSPASLANLLRARALFDGGGCISSARGPVQGPDFDAAEVERLLSGQGDFYAAYHVPFVDTWAQCSLAALHAARGEPEHGRQLLRAALGAYPGRGTLVVALAELDGFIGPTAAAEGVAQLRRAWPRLRTDSLLAKRAEALGKFSLEALASRQVVLVVADGWGSTRGRLWRFERGAGPWRVAGEPFDVVLGRSGLAWGSGLHPPEQQGPRKQEGDGRAVAGVFSLGAAFGYSDAPPTGTKLPYSRSGADLRCVDDPGSASYNRIVTAPTTRDWSTSEAMRRDDDLYRWVIPVGHNVAPVKAGGGSCVFLHVWRGPDNPTAGCVAAPEARLVELLAWLRPAARPVLVQLTKEDHARLLEEWALPSVPSLARGLLAAESGGAGGFYAKSLALVVGIDAYSAGWPRLSQAVSDARLVAAELRRVGFEVVLLENSKRDQLLAQIKTRLPERVGKDDRFVFYFAGHGQTWTSPATAAKLGYLVPADGSRTDGRDDWHTYISMKELNDELSARFATRHLLLVFDSCFSGIALTRSGGPSGPVRGHLRKEGVTVLTAGGEGELARDGLFTQILVNGLKGEADAGAHPDGVVTFGELAVYVEREVQAQSRTQTPRYGWLRGEGQMLFEVKPTDEPGTRR